MAHRDNASDLSRRMRGFAERIGHDFVWLIIAGLFCVVEVAVHLTTPLTEKRPRTLRS